MYVTCIVPRVCQVQDQAAAPEDEATLPKVDQQQRTVDDDSGVARGRPRETASAS